MQNNQLPKHKLEGGISLASYASFQEGSAV